MTENMSIIAAFLLCGGALASKDLVIKFLFNNGVSFSQVVFYTGLFGFASSVILIIINKEPIKINKLSYQVRRMFIVSASGVLAFYSFKLLSPTVINIGSKMTLPLMIISSPLLSLPYSRKEKWSAVATLFVMFVFFYDATKVDESSILGLVVLVLSTLAMIAEYMTLSYTVNNETLALVSSVPSLSLVVLGSILSYILCEPLVIDSPTQLMFLVLCGILYFVVYYSGVIRYRLLPPGIAEFPSLISIFIVWPVDKLYFNGNISINTLVFGLIAIVMVGYIIYQRNR